MTKEYYIYILRNYSGNFYIGFTSNLTFRLWQHKNKVGQGFTSQYNIDKLIYYEAYQNVEEAIAREKQLKNWNRQKKIDLISRLNPELKEIDISG